jgi:hypothetical protein
MATNSVKYNNKYTLVQHSGYGYGGKPAFSRALEQRHVPDARTEREILKRGGFIGTYEECDEIVDKVFLNAKGEFSDYMIDDLRLYIPVREIVG